MVRKLVKIFLILVLLLIISGFFINSFISRKIAEVINSSSTEQMTFGINKVRFDIISGNTAWYGIRINSRDRRNDSIAVSIDTLMVTGISPFNFIKRKEISFREFRIQGSRMNLYQGLGRDEGQMESDTAVSGTISSVSWNKLLLRNAALNYFDVNNDTLVSSREITAGFKEFTFNFNTSLSQNPFLKVLEHMHTDHFVYRVNEVEKITVLAMDYEDKDLKFRNINWTPLYDKIEFQKHISTEYDRIDMEIPVLNANDLHLELQGDSLHSIGFDHILLDSLNAEIYRNKALPDDTGYKKLYSKLLRDLPFLLRIDSLMISNASLVYQERLPGNETAGEIRFSKLNAGITNIDNDVTNGRPTEIVVNTLFMDDGELDINWDFMIRDTLDNFRIRGQLRDLKAADVNTFVTPNLNAYLSGSIDKLNFDILGNNWQANGKIIMGFRDFKVNLLREDSDKVKKIATSVVNILVKNSREYSAEDEKEIGVVQRDLHKSFFNFLWKCLQQGIMAEFTSVKLKGKHKKRQG